MTTTSLLRVIDLTRVRSVLAEIDQMMEVLDGQDLDESNAITSQAKSRSRQERAQMSQDLQRLATRFELAASLVRIEYWAARGERDPLDPRRQT